MLMLQLERFGRLSSEEKLALGGVSQRPRRLGRGSEISREEERADCVDVLLAGFACRYAVLPSGRRQILAYLLPGEFCDRYRAGEMVSDHCVGTLSAAKIGCYSREELDSVRRRFPRIARALELSDATEQATLRQWLLSVGRRGALERTAHLLCELFIRLHCLGFAREGVCDIPMRQTDLADALALSAVHLNRTLAELRRRKLATFLHHELNIQDLRSLQLLGGFQPQYLFAGNPLPGFEAMDGSDALALLVDGTASAALPSPTSAARDGATGR